MPLVLAIAIAITIRFTETPSDEVSTGDAGESIVQAATAAPMLSTWSVIDRSLVACMLAVLVIMMTICM